MYNILITDTHINGNNLMVVQMNRVHFIVSDESCNSVVFLHSNPMPITFMWAIFYKAFLC